MDENRSNWTAKFYTQWNQLDELTMAKKKSGQNMFVSVLYPYNEKNIAKPVTVWKLCERSSKWDLAGCLNFNRLEMTLGWRRGGQECQSWLQQQ